MPADKWSGQNLTNLTGGAAPVKAWVYMRLDVNDVINGSIRSKLLKYGGVANG